MSRRSYQPMNTYPSTKLSGGGLRFHHTMCRVDGGPGVPHGVCRKCLMDTERAFEIGLRRLDRQANRGR